jgi:hypothetical protein
MSHMHDSPLKFSSFMMEREIKFTKSEIEGWDVYGENPFPLQECVF